MPEGAWSLLYRGALHAVPAGSPFPPFQIDAEFHRQTMHKNVCGPHAHTHVRCLTFSTVKMRATVPEVMHGSACV